MSFNVATPKGLLASCIPTYIKNDPSRNKLQGVGGAHSQ